MHTVLTMHKKIKKHNSNIEILKVLLFTVSIPFPIVNMIPLPEIIITTIWKIVLLIKFMIISRLLFFNRCHLISIILVSIYQKMTEYYPLFTLSSNTVQSSPKYSISTHKRHGLRRISYMYLRNLRRPDIPLPFLALLRHIDGCRLFDSVQRLL